LLLSNPKFPDDNAYINVSLKNGQNALFDAGDLPGPGTLVPGIDSRALLYGYYDWAYFTIIQSVEFA
jgi:hypothetical protein